MLERSALVQSSSLMYRFEHKFLSGLLHDEIRNCVAAGQLAVKSVFALPHFQYNS